MGAKQQRKLWLKACAGKVKYATVLAVEYALDQLPSDAGQEIYMCKFCSHYHLGTTRKKKRKNKKR